MYAILVNNVLQYAAKNFTTDDGRLIINFNKNIGLMKEYGYKEVVDIKPIFDVETQYIQVSGYTENEDNITVNYEVLELTTTESESTLEDRIVSLEGYNVDIIATTFDIDFRLCEVEWTLEDAGIVGIGLANVLKQGVATFTLSRYEQAKIIILGGKYNEEHLTNQLVTYLNREYILQEEYDELMELMK